jgi:hypothetical protein
MDSSTERLDCNGLSGVIALLLAALVFVSVLPQIAGWKISADPENLFNAFVDDSTAHGGSKSVRLELLGNDRYFSEAAVFQSIKARDYRASRRNVICYIKTTNFQGQISLAVLAYTSGESGLLFSTLDKHARGTNDWHSVALSFEVAVPTNVLTFGVYIKNGRGRVWIDDFRLQVDSGGKTLALSGKSVTLRRSELVQLTSAMENAPTAPLNLDFEQ